MATADPTQLAIWRTAPYSVYTDAYIHAPAVVFQARVNAPSTTYPVTSIPYDTVTVGVVGDIQAEQLLLIGSAAGADDLGRLRVHSPHIGGGGVADGTQIFVGRASQGTRDGEVNVIDNAYLTVLDLRLIWAAPPRIDALQNSDNPLTYKDGVILFTSGQEFRPIVNIGGDRLKKVDTSGGTADFDFDAGRSIVTNPSAGGSKTYAWSVGDGTIISGSTSTAAITVTYPVGARYIRCTVTDDQHTGEVSWRLVVVTYPDDPNLISQCTLKRTQPADGQEVSLQVDSLLPYATYPDGTEVLIRQRERYGTALTGSLAGQDDAEDMIFAGWIQSEPNTSGEMKKTGYRTNTTLQLVDAAGKLKTLPGFPLVVERRNSTVTTTLWEHMNTATMDRYAYHIQKWHSNLWSRCDFFWSGTTDTYPIPTLGSDGQSLWDQIKFVTNAIACLLTCDKNGRIWMVGDPNIQPSADQASAASLPVQRTTTVIVDIGTGDWKHWQFDYTRSPRVHWNWGNAIVASTIVPADNVNIGTVFCVAPGQAPGQGLDEQTSGQQLVCPGAPQDELDAREYNRYQARMNARLGNIQFEIRPGDIGIDPALGQWVTVTIDASTAAQRGRTLSGNFLPTQVQYEYDGQHGTCKQTLSLEQEINSAFFAEIDLSHTLPSGVTFPPAPLPTPVPVLPGAPYPIGSGTFNLALFDATNSALYLGDIRSAFPSWTKVDLTALSGWAGTLAQFIQDAFATANGVVITTTKAFQLLGVGNSPSLANAHSFAFTTAFRSLQSERGDNGFFACVSYRTATGGGSREDIDASTDDGISWTNYASVFGTWIGGPGDGVAPGCYVSPHAAGKFYTSGYTGAGVITAAIYVCTANGATRTRLNSFTFQTLAGDITIPYQDTSEGTIYHGGGVPVSGHTEFRLWKSTASSQTDVSPTDPVTGHKFGPLTPFSIKFCDVDQRSGLLVGFDNDLGGSSSHWCVFLTRDGWATSKVIVAAGVSVPYHGGCFAGNDPNMIFLWGDGAFAVSYDGGATIIDLSGNLSTFSAGDIVNIAGVGV